MFGVLEEKKGPHDRDTNFSIGNAGGVLKSMSHLRTAGTTHGRYRIVAVTPKKGTLPSFMGENRNGRPAEFLQRCARKKSPRRGTKFLLIYKKKKNAEGSFQEKQSDRAKKIALHH